MKILTELELGGEVTHRISGPDMCELLAISPAALSDLRKRGIAVRLGHDSYDLAASVSAYVTHLRGVASGRGGEEHTASLTAERARLAKEQADAQALKNAALRGEMVSASEVTRAWAEVLRQVRSRVLAVPSRIRSVLPHLNASEVASIDRELRTALEDLAHADD
ncbi:terminase small subunit [Paenirhodobacter populi]|uniref:terminase small subunit n=1 Tax=Paenirhodobacter populi TaxID=2306993 RepID=UPI000FE2CDEB|nr:terminase small subunit [Sinirhodobacter populi]RWR07709.1 DNA packaging protein [Sinirhodobacter populi]